MQEIIVNVNENGNKIVALVENGKMVEKYDEDEKHRRLEGNIYIGRVENILYGMQAAFVNIGEGKNTFIHIRDIIPKASNETGNKDEVLSKHDIKNYLRVGMPILVQVKKDSTNKKGARVSTHISLSGRFVVLMPNAEFITVSQKIEDVKEKERLKKIVKNNIAEGYGAIVRTSAIGKNEMQISSDIQMLVSKFKDILERYEKVKNDKCKPQLIYQNEGIVNRLLVDLIDQKITKIWTNSDEELKKIEDMVKNTNNQEKIKIELKKDNLLSLYDLNSQIEKMENRKIWLKCGGFITIDKTEALTAIDVNSGKYIGSKDLEQTVFVVNKEASIEIANQIRLRDIGGIIIIDYIDMEKQETKNKIAEVLKENLKKDRSKTQIIGFTPLDLLEMTRKHMWSND